MTGLGLLRAATSTSDLALASAIDHHRAAQVEAVMVVVASTVTSVGLAAGSLGTADPLLQPRDRVKGSAKC
jgi:hypothetical protein